MGDDASCAEEPGRADWERETILTVVRGRGKKFWSVFGAGDMLCGTTAGGRLSLSAFDVGASDVAEP